MCREPACNPAVRNHHLHATAPRCSAEHLLQFGGAHSHALAQLPSYLALNPFGKIPSLVDNGPTDGPVVLFESIAIAKYVAMTYAPGTLVPASVMDQVKLEQIMQVRAVAAERRLALTRAQVEANYITANLFKAVSPLFRFELGMAPSVDMKAVAEALDHADILTGVVFLEAALAASAATGPPFLVGNAMTLAECAIFPFFNWYAGGGSGRAI